MIKILIKNINKSEFSKTYKRKKNEYLVGNLQAFSK